LDLSVSAALSGAMMERSKKNSVPLLLGIYAALMILLGLTVVAARFPLGAFGLLVALLIAGAKAILVILVFMEVRLASRLTWLFVGAGFVWLAIMFSLTFAEYWGRERGARAEPLNVIERRAPSVSR
jgi:cytochrome c oxidase subunit 4